jgi:hypothetical protein
VRSMPGPKRAVTNQHLVIQKSALKSRR